MTQARHDCPSSTARWAVAALAALVLAATPAPAQPPDLDKAGLALVADGATYAPGAAAVLVAKVTIDEGWHVNAHVPTYDYLIPTALELELPAGWTAGGVTYPEPKLQRFKFADDPLAVYDGTVEIRAEARVPAGSPAGSFPVRAVLHYQACDDSTCLPPNDAEASMELKIGSGAAATAGEPGSGRGPAAGAGGIGLVILLALLGGLILNAMPCVLPVLSLKVFGLMRSAGQGRREVVSGGLATAAGILVSFWALAAVAIAARAAGSAVGWGTQFQRPGFVAFLAVVMVLFCLNLWGLFEITLPWRATQVVGGHAREGVAGHFTTGLFATLMATPCSAPFLGPAVGFALGQEPGMVISVFTAIGLGMSLPYLLLVLWPGSARLLPRPGAWMDTLKGTMGFLLAGAAVWLLWVLGSQVSAERVAAIELALLAVALLVWLRQRAVPGSALRWAVAVALVVATVAPLLLAASAERGVAPRAGKQVAGLIAWVPFDRGRAEALAAAGTTVFVDVTADWCLTCKVNERLVLETADVAAAFVEHGVVAMKADWTNRDEAIGAFLAEHGRYGIPFYLLYRPGREPYVFSELLTRERLIARVRESGAAAQRVAVQR
jgi:suppressor for copper-sensitivity B